ncbi:MAG: hypothetical protein ACHQ7N_12275 [Candidatus Methylomirabilales bacterium]
MRILEADPATDWSEVNLERLRQHLIDMNGVTLRSEVKSAVVPGGLMMEVTVTGRTEQAIRRMVVPLGVREQARGRAQVMVPASAATSDRLTSWSLARTRSRSCCRLTAWAPGSSW